MSAAQSESSGSSGSVTLSLRLSPIQTLFVNSSQKKSCDALLITLNPENPNGFPPEIIAKQNACAPPRILY